VAQQHWGPPATVTLYWGSAPDPTGELKMDTPSPNPYFLSCSSPIIIIII